MRYVSTISVMVLALAASAAGVSYVTITDDAVGYKVELPKGFKAVADLVEDPAIIELTGGRPYAMSTYVWEGGYLEGMGFAAVKVGDGGVSTDKMELYVNKTLNAEQIPYEQTDLNLTAERLSEIGADSGTGLQYKAEVEGMVLKVNIYYLQKGDASYLVLLGWPMDAGFAGLGEHIDETFRLK